MTGPQHPTSGGAASGSDLDFAKKLLAAREAGLDSVRASAAKWQAGLSGLLGGVVGAVGVGLRPTLAGLQLDWAIAVAVVVATAFVLAFVSVFFALRAAGGVPKLVKVADWRDTDGHLAASAAIGQLRTARWLTAGAITAFLLAMGGTWFAPDRTEYASVTTGTQQACGSVEVSGGNLLVTDSDRVVHVFDISAITDWQTVTSCPLP